MITQANLFSKQCRKLAVLVALTTSTVALTAQETLAIPLEPILGQMGRCMIKGLVGTDSSDQAAPLDSQSFTGTQQETSSPQYPAYAPPTYPQGYPSPTYPTAYPPGSPSGYSAYPPPAYSSPAPTPGRSATPVIINNF